MKFCLGLQMKTNTIFIKNERHTNSPTWCINTFKLAKENEVDQEERGQPNTHEDGTNLKGLTTYTLISRTTIKLDSPVIAK